ncbi:hypothetical protein [Acinetobacter sp.]|nr:hypothetical protein [Acinetobacter sp.]
MKHPQQTPAAAENSELTISQCSALCVIALSTLGGSSLLFAFAYIFSSSI